VRTFSKTVAGTLLFLVTSVSTWAAENNAPQTEPGGAQSLPKDYACLSCHSKDGEFWSPSTPVVTEADLVNDIHWQKGLRCHDCHGSTPTLDDYIDHRSDPSFRYPRQPSEIPDFCGHCHSDIDYMRRYNPSSRTDQVAEYWTSGHGRRLKATTEDPDAKPDEQVATCINCHGKHQILAVADQSSPVYPTHVAETCSKCHSDEKVMAGRTYHDRPLGHDQYARWQKSVHGQALLEKGDMSAPTCNDCHGNHGAMPPGVDTVANACGACHGKVAGLFANTRMRHRFEEVGLPGCATCHGNHDIVHPPDDDEFLGMTPGTFCEKCHDSEDAKYDATLAGANVAKTLRAGLEQLKHEIENAETKIQEAERLGMEVSGPRFDLRQAKDARTNARALIHSFAPDPMQQALDDGLRVTEEVTKRAEDALQEHTSRRVWLAASLVPILIVVCLLLLYIRALPIPDK